MPIPTATRSIGDFLNDIPRRQALAAEVRYLGPPGNMSEAPRGVYQAACASVAAWLESTVGFAYTKSVPCSRVNVGEMTFEVRFQSNYYNLTGSLIEISVDAIVGSPRMKKWRKAQGSENPHGYCAGAHLGELMPENPRLRWNLVRPPDRDRIVGEIAHLLETTAFPYFEQFEDLPEICEFLAEHELRGMLQDYAIDFLMCFAGSATARRSAVSFLRRRPDLVSGYRETWIRYADDSQRPKIPNGYIEDLAVSSYRFDWGDLSEGL